MIMNKDTIGDLSDEEFRHAIMIGQAETLKDIDKKYGLEEWYEGEEILGLYFCSKCKYCHYFSNSKIGQSHFKYYIHWLERALRNRQFYTKVLGE